MSFEASLAVEEVFAAREAALFAFETAGLGKDEMFSPQPPRQHE